MNDDDSLALRIFDRIKSAGLPVIDNVSLICAIWVDSAQDIHQCGFSCPVLSYQSMNLSLFHLKIHVIKSFDTGESFGDIFHFEQYLCQNGSLLNPKDSLSKKTGGRLCPPA
jgi:hypothetical protein